MSTKPNQLTDIQHKTLLYGLCENEEPLNFSEPDTKDLVYTILKKRPHHRDELEAQYLRKVFGEFKIFKDMEEYLTPKLMVKLCRELTHLTKAQNEVVFYEGDIGKRFFIIIDGEV